MVTLYVLLKISIAVKTKASKTKCHDQKKFGKERIYFMSVFITKNSQG